MSKLRVLILAEQCNPEWPSLPIVGYKYAKALAEIAEVTLVTQIRNKENIDKAGDFPGTVEYIDTEWVAAPVYKLATWFRGGTKVAWSLQMMMMYPQYVAFELQVWRRFKKQLRAGDFDIVHRATPMSPTMPSAMAGRGGVPFVVGPLNGNLDWPAAFAPEKKREKEGIRVLRNAYKWLPYAGRTLRRASAFMAGFQHTIADLKGADPSKIISVPEVGVDTGIFHDAGRTPAFGHDGPYEFLFAGRIVPYKVADVAVRAFVTSEALKAHKLTIIGEGPDEPMLRQIVAEHGAEDRVIFEGLKSQDEVADAMRRADAFVFPSIRELGAGVVVEAMACGALLVVTDYGAPGDLCANGRGVTLPMADKETLVAQNRAAMEACLADPKAHQALAMAGRDYAHSGFTWQAKAAFTQRVYEAVLRKDDLGQFIDYQ